MEALLHVSWKIFSLMLVKTITQTSILVSTANRIYVWWIIRGIVLCLKFHLEASGKVSRLWETLLLVSTLLLILSSSR
jgi:hypothetical protein